MNNKNSASIRFMSRLALLSAIILIMSFTPLGYLRTAGLEITLLTIPVAVGAIVLGPSAGAFLGGLFGLTSFAQCFGMSAFGAALLAINPVFTFIVCFFPRLLMGWLTGVIFAFLKKTLSNLSLGCTIASLCAPLLNTIFFMSTLMLLFSRTEFIMSMRGDMPLLPFVIAFISINGLVEIPVCCIFSAVISRALLYFTEKRGV